MTIDELRDLLVEHGIDLERLKNYESDEMLKILDEYNTEIRDRILKTKSIEQKSQYDKIIKDIKAFRDNMTQALWERLQNELRSLISEESDFAARSILDNTDNDIKTIDADKTLDTIAFKPYTASGNDTFESYINSLGDNVVKTWDAQLRGALLTAIATGVGFLAGDIIKAVLGTKKAPGGTMAGLRNSLIQNTKDMVGYTSNEARQATYDNNSAKIEGYVRVEILDTKTCIMCGLEDLKFYKTKAEAPTLPVHPNCRGFYLPKVKGEELGAGLQKTWSQWLSEQSDKKQREVLGPTRFNAYKAGLKVNSFVSDGKKLTLDELIEKNGLKLYGAGLKARTRTEKEQYADVYYSAIRNRKSPTDIAKVAQNSGFSEKDITDIRAHVFTAQHNLGNGKTGRFETDWRMAQAWQRMEMGWKGNGMTKYKNLDLLLLKHEKEELTLMREKGYDAIEAHEETCKKYDWYSTLKKEFPEEAD
jgi:hypothetical protein